MKLRKIALILAVACLLLSITACSEKTKPESEILEDFKSCFFQDYPDFDFNSINVSIYNRETSTSDGIDFICAYVSASNDDLMFYCDYYIMYRLNDSGWLISDWNRLYSQISVLRSTVTEDQAEYALQNENLANYDSVALVNRNTDLEHGEDTFYFECQYTEGYLTAVDTIEVRYSHTPIGGWNLESVSRISTAETWDVLGKWEYNADGESMWLYIHEISDGTITVEFDFDYTWEYDSAWYGLTREHKHFTSDGTETRQLEATENGTSFNLMNNMPSTPYVYISKTQGVTFDGYWSNPDDSYIFAYAGK